MDHSCYKCGHNIEDGKAFCSECGAPQIRVALAEVPAELIAEPEGSFPSASHAAESNFPVLPIHPIPARWSRALRPCALAASVSVVLMFLGLHPFVAALGTGFLAATFSQRTLTGTLIRPASAAKFGALGGLLLFCMSTAVEVLVILTLHKQQAIRSEMMERIQRAAAAYPGPQVAPFLEFIQTPQGFTFMLILSLIFGLAAFLVLGSIGGAISGALAARRRK